MQDAPRDVEARLHEWTTNPLFRVALLQRKSTWSRERREFIVQPAVSSIYAIESVLYQGNELSFILVNHKDRVQYWTSVEAFMAFRVENSMVDLMPQSTNIDALVAHAQEQVQGFIEYQFKHLQLDLCDQWYALWVSRREALAWTAINNQLIRDHQHIGWIESQQTEVGP